MRRLGFVCYFAICSLASLQANAYDVRIGMASGQDVIGRVLAERSSSNFLPLDRIPPERRQRIERLWDQAADILAASPLLETRQSFRRLAEEERAIRRQIAEDRTAQIVAPPPPDGFLGRLRSLLSPAWTKADYAARISRSEARLRQIEEERVLLRERFVSDLEKIGVRLRVDQVDSFLSLASSDDMLSLQTLFVNLRGIVNSLRDQAKAAGDSLEVARRLYGLHAVLLEIALDAHRDLIRKIDHEWDGRLVEIERSTRDLREESKRILQTERDSALQEVIRANITAQELTLRAIALYRQRLAEQRASIEASLRRLEAQARVAINTWATAERAADLSALLRFSDRAVEALALFEVPPVRPFDSRELQGEVERLTERLREIRLR